MIKIDTESQEPLVDQVIQSLKNAIASGRLAAGQELPSARQLGGDLGIHFNTVARAYRHLSELGLLFVAHGRKTYVRDFWKSRTAVTKTEKKEIKKMFCDALTQAQLVGMEISEARKLLENAIASLSSDKKGVV